MAEQKVAQSAALSSIVEIGIRIGSIVGIGFGSIGVVAFLCLAALPMVFVRAYVLTKLWFWFLVPAGFGALPFGVAVGASLIVTFLTPMSGGSRSVTSTQIMNILVFPLITLLLGYIAHLFV